jgi:hypothetical protein
VALFTCHKYWYLGIGEKPRQRKSRVEGDLWRPSGGPGVRLPGSDLGARRRALVLRAPGLVALPVQQRRQLQRHVGRFSLLLARLSHLAASNRRGSFCGIGNQRIGRNSKGKRLAATPSS